MNTHLTPEQSQEILSYADKFFISEENQSTFTRYFLTLLLGITIICNKGLLALEELCDEVTPPFLKALFRLTIDGFWYEKKSLDTSSYDSDVLYKEELYKQKQDKLHNYLLNTLHDTNNKDFQFLALFSWKTMELFKQLDENTQIEAYKDMVNLIPESCNNFKSKLQHDISFPYFRETSIFKFYCPNRWEHCRGGTYASWNVILLNSKNPDLSFIKEFYNYPMFFYSVLPGDFDKIPENGVLGRTKDKYILSATINSDGTMNFVTENEEKEVVPKTTYKPIIFTTKNQRLITCLKLNNKEVWFSDDIQFTVPINGNNSRICGGSIITYERNGIPYFIYNGKEYNGFPVYAPVQGFVYLLNGNIEFQAYSFPSHKMKDSLFYHKKRYQYMMNYLFEMPTVTDCPIGAFEKANVPSGFTEPEYEKAISKLVEIYKNSIIASYGNLLKENRIEYKIICSDSEAYIYFPEKQSYFCISFNDFEKNQKNVRDKLKCFLFSLNDTSL